MKPGLCSRNIQILVGVAIQSSGELLIQSSAHKFVAGSYDESSTDPGLPRPKLAVLDRHNFAVEDVDSREMPKAAEESAVALSVLAARVSELHAIRDSFGNAEGVNIADDVRRVHKVITDGRVRKEFVLGRIDHVGGGCDEAAGLSLQR